MPKFDFFCRDCGLLFDKLVADSSVKESTCPSCKATASRHFTPHTVGVTYKSGMPPTASIDQIVGLDSEKKWEKLNQQHSDANAIRKATNSHVVEVSTTGEMRAASEQTVKTRREVSDIIVNGQ